MRDFVHHVERRFGTKVDTVRTNNALELTEYLALSFYKELDIENQTSCIDTPQQNGVVERKHRHLLETGALLC